ILVEMDGFEKDTNVIIFAASVTGDTPVLVKQGENYELKPIADVIDPYYREGEEGREKPAGDLQVLGMDQRQRFFSGSATKNISFDSSAYKNVRSVFRHRVNEIYEIEYLGGKLRTTGNHSVFVRTRQGVVAKRVDELAVGEFLVDIPYVANRTQKDRREVRAHVFAPFYYRELPVYTTHTEEEKLYAFAMEQKGVLSQSAIAQQIGVTQPTVSHWQRNMNGPRILSREYFLHELPEKVIVTPDLMRLFGYYVSEGYARKEIDFCFNEKEIAYQKDVKDLMFRIFGLHPRTERHTTPNAVNIIYSSKPLADFFIRYCGKGAHNKHIPPFLFEAPKEYFQAFLQGHVNGDGYVDSRGRIELTSVSRRLILELNWLSRMHGHKSFVRRMLVPAGRRINGGNPLPETIAYRLGFGKSQNPLQKNEGRTSIKRPKILKITKQPFNGFVYDFCGCENEAFFGGENPMLLHNTNRPDILDPALLRPGRFDRRVMIDIPDLREREAILKVHARSKPFTNEVNLKTVAQRTTGFSGADLESLLNEAAILAARRNKKKITMDECLESIDKVLLGPERKNRVMSEREKKITAYHEAGHALVAHILPHADPVHKISIISRGRAGGYTLKLPEEDKHIHSKREFEADIAVGLGGMVSEKLIFDEVTTGPSNDLQNATKLARQLVTKYGMSDKLGPRTFNDREELPFLGREIAEQRNYGEKIADLIDSEVSKFLEKGYTTAEDVISKQREKLDLIANRLMAKETIEREEFEALMAGKNLPPLEPPREPATPTAPTPTPEPKPKTRIVPQPV
ncbi:MAG: hypothetical protein HYV34_03750, partial [Candidatus Kerfeldbacteria bacterium]|nr:hypothetical protein [Candidatus Kerfeldbacteria bacterium]